MKYLTNLRITIVSLAAFLLAILILCPEKVYADDSLLFAGNGTQDSPYLIEDLDDLHCLRDQVNAGEIYKDVYFRQTSDIDLSSENWTPIGLVDSGCYFDGIYDGAGYTISNLCIEQVENEVGINGGLFGQLGGVVTNLRVVDAQLEGEHLGIIANNTSSKEDDAAIINCYTSGTINGSTVGGIAFCFDGGVIAHCMTDVSYDVSKGIDQTGWEVSELSGGILGLWLDTKMYQCRTTASQLAPDSGTSGVVDPTQANFEDIFDTWNDNTYLTQELFGDQYHIQLLPWCWQEGPYFSSDYSYKGYLIKAINDYALTILLGIILIIFVYKYMRTRREERWEKFHKKFVGLFVVSGIISAFIDSAAVTVAKDDLNVGNILFLILSNIAFVFAAVQIRKHLDLRKWIKTGNKLLMMLIAVVCVLALLQFHVAPRYDASLYYGSFVKGISTFRMDLLSYLGSFNCWKLMQGSALLLAPFEFFMRGYGYGVYISTLIIMVSAIVMLYHLLTDIFRQTSGDLLAICSVIVVLLPYQLGLFTYFCLDNLLPYYAVFLLYAYKKQNNYLIAFCGFLLSFTKITGLVFYAVFLMAASFVQLLKRDNKDTFVKWLDIPGKILWIIPAVLYLLINHYGGLLTIQYFLGASTRAITGGQTIVSLGNTLVQSFVYGFRWLLLIMIAVAIVVALVKRYSIKSMLTQDGMAILYAVTVACAAVVVMLLYYDGEAECPRYTAILNVAYALWIPVAIAILCQKDNLRTAIATSLAGLFLVQTYWTIDPTIISNQLGMWTGKKQLYKLSLNHDKKSGMNLGMDYGEGYGTIGDIYAYNYEYSFYDNLINQMLKDIQPTEDQMFYVLDVEAYELHMHGLQYRMYWNSEWNKMTYKRDGENSVFIASDSILTEDVVDGTTILQDDFYMIVVARVNDSKIMDYFMQNGYTIDQSLTYGNLYGTMSVYHVRKV